MCTGGPCGPVGPQRPGARRPGGRASVPPSHGQGSELRKERTSERLVKAQTSRTQGSLGGRRHAAWGAVPVGPGREGEAPEYLLREHGTSVKPQGAHSARPGAGSAVGSPRATSAVACSVNKVLSEHIVPFGRRQSCVVAMDAGHRRTPDILIIWPFTKGVLTPGRDTE